MKLAIGLPQNIAASLGRIVALWSQEEHILRNILANAAGTSIKAVRISFKEPGTEAFANTVRDLLMIENIEITGTGLNDVAKALKDAKERRDILVHSQWGYDLGILGVQCVRGSWDIGHLVKKPPRIAKKVLPEFLPVDSVYLSDTRRMIQKCIRMTRQLDRRVAAIRRSLQQRYLEQACPKNPPDQAAKRPRSRRQPLQR